ncbi:type VI secretion system membrane subunit TssM [Parashewanella curva]|uniref:Type VI secretion system membrane subunit TssM n=1 Tax=Parashewanella curva TaxID=2338552 RepID=A0A3L8Q1B4_9GAMM|nr:type VI secretion system membrane subunit TssM [Parashewanella curva]RLV61250.1 type VI secretion system membrane subunit TssM [Parashewanella curva]
MFKKILVVFTVLLSALFTCLLWWYIPSVSTYSWLKYLGIVITLVLLGMAIFWWMKRLDKKKQSDPNHDEYVLLNQDTKALKRLFKQAVKKLKGRSGSRLKSLYDQPWYLVLGGEKDAKSSFLLQNNLEPLLDKLLEEQDSQQLIRFWHNDQIVALEVGARIFNNESLDDKLWKLVSQQLLSHRPRQGVNGIISIIGSDRLLLGDKKTRLSMSTVIQEATLAMSDFLKLHIPVYCVLSKADLIADFVPFFEIFSGCDIDNPFGITFPITQDRRFDADDFENQTERLLESVVDQQFELITNIDADKAASIIALPYQLRIFFKLVIELLTAIGKENRVRDAVWLRGVYLLSCGQKGKQFDLLSQSIAETAEFNTNARLKGNPGRRNYFSARIFSNIIYPENEIVGVNHFRHFGYIAGQSLLIAGVCAIVAYTSVLLKNNWNTDEIWRAEALSKLNIYKEDIKRLNSSDENISHLVAVLSELRKVAVTGIEDAPWYERVSTQQDDTARRIYHIYQQQLQKELLPKIDYLISKELYIYVSFDNPTKIFEVLRYYEMLFDKHRLDLEDLKQYILDTLQEQDKISVHNLTNLSNLLSDLLSSKYSKSLKANHKLITTATSSLDGMSPERLIYTRIKGLPKYRNQVDVRNQLGDNFDSLFRFSDGYHGYLIPEIFTKQGLNQLDLSPKSKLLREQLEDYRAIKGDMSSVSITEMNDLSKDVQNLYFADYIQHWKDLIKNIHIKQFSSTVNLSYALHKAREPVTSPILDVLGAIVSNTRLAVEEKPDTKGNQKLAKQLGLKSASKALGKANRINRALGNKILSLQPSFVVNKAFQSYADFLKGTGRTGDKLPVTGLIDSLDELNTYFEKALSSPEPNKSMYDYAKEHAAGTQDPLTNFEREAAKAPAQVGKWANNIAVQSWHSVVQSDIQYINQQWNDNIYSFYTQAILGRFPFTQNGRSEVALADFSNFFKPQGLVDSFINTYLKPFVSWDQGKLKLETVDGAILPVKKQSLDTLAQSKQLSGMFFGSGQELALNLGFMPTEMSSDVSSFVLRGDEDIFSYNHGPRIWSDLSWPSNRINGFLSASFFNGANRVAFKTYRGQWALFRMLFDGEGKQTSSRLIRRLDYSIDKKQLTFSYTLRNSSQHLALNLINQFKLLPNL